MQLSVWCCCAEAALLAEKDIMQRKLAMEADAADLRSLREQLQVD